MPNSFPLKKKVIVGKYIAPHPLCVCFLAQFSRGKVKSAEDFHIPICFPSQNEKNSTFFDLDFFLVILCSICSLTVPCGSSLSVHCITYYSTAAICCHCPQLKAVTATTAAVAVQSRFCCSVMSAALVISPKIGKS
jgi:hypothetical protein